MKYENQDSAFEGYLHVTDERVIQVCRSDEDNRCYMLSELGTIEQTCDQLVQDLALSDQNWGDIPALLLSRKEFGDIYTSVTDHNCDDIGDRSQIDGRCRRFHRFGEMHEEQGIFGELQLSIWNGISWESQNAAFIVNESMNWLLRMSLEGDQDWLTAAPATKSSFVICYSCG